MCAKYFARTDYLMMLKKCRFLVFTANVARSVRQIPSAWPNSAPAGARARGSRIRVSEAGGRAGLADVPDFEARTCASGD